MEVFKSMTVAMMTCQWSQLNPQQSALHSILMVAITAKDQTSFCSRYLN